jgi:CheY-like chemotaxis protein
MIGFRRIRQDLREHRLHSTLAFSWDRGRPARTSSSDAGGTSAVPGELVSSDQKRRCRPGQRFHFTEICAALSEFDLVALCQHPHRRGHVMTDVAVVALSILVADDEEGIRNLLVHWLHDRGHNVVPVRSANEALRFLSGETVDLVITDVVMPDGDGFELISSLRKTHPETRILAMSGGGRYLRGVECLKMARGLGAHAVVMKPFNWEQLQAAIDSAVLRRASNSAEPAMRFE